MVLVDRMVSNLKARKEVNRQIRILQEDLEYLSGEFTHLWDRATPDEQISYTDQAKEL